METGEVAVERREVEAETVEIAAEIVVEEAGAEEDELWAPSILKP